MLCIISYKQKYINECKSKVEYQISTYKNLVAIGGNQKGAGKASLDTAIESFEPVFVNNMVLVPDTYSCHRSRTIELKDGNPLNEVRIKLFPNNVQ